LIVIRGAKCFNILVLLYLLVGEQLNQQLDCWLSEAAQATHAPARAIISPHAGYQYCGSCAAYAYKQVVPANM